jgi:hypothetical protein
MMTPLCNPAFQVGHRIPFDHWWIHQGKQQRRDVSHCQCAAKWNAYNIHFSEATLTSFCADRKRGNCIDELLHQRSNISSLKLDSLKFVYACFKAGEYGTKNSADTTFNTDSPYAREQSCSTTNLEKSVHRFQE